MRRARGIVPAAVSIGWAAALLAIGPSGTAGGLPLPTTLPSVTVPTPTVPTVTVPPPTLAPITLPPPTLPPPTVAPITLAPITVPTVTLPPPTLAPITLPPVTLAPITLPPVTLAPIAVPTVTIASTVPLSPAPVTAPAVTLAPTVPLSPAPGVAVPGTTSAPAAGSLPALPGASLPAASLPVGSVAGSVTGSATAGATGALDPLDAIVPGVVGSQTPDAPTGDAATAADDRSSTAAPAGPSSRRGPSSAGSPDRSGSGTAGEVAVQGVAAQTHELLRSRLCDYGDQLAPWLAAILCPVVASSPPGGGGDGFVERVFPVLGGTVGTLAVAAAIVVACGLALRHAGRARAAGVPGSAAHGHGSR